MAQRRQKPKPTKKNDVHLLLDEDLWYAVLAVAYKEGRTLTSEISRTLRAKYCPETVAS